MCWVNKKCFNKGSGRIGEGEFTLVAPKERYELSGESRRGRLREDFTRREDAINRAKNYVDDLFTGLDADAIETGSITVRKVKN